MLQPPEPSKPPPVVAPPPRVSSASLFGRHRELVVEHNGREYRLQVTRSGKLILTA